MNERIKNLFLEMIKSPEKIDSVNYNEIWFGKDLRIRYSNTSKNKEADNTPLKLSSVTTDNWYWEIINADINQPLIFTIVTPYRVYQVPNFEDRVEYAQVLDTLDKTLAEFEERKLREYEDLFYAK